MSDSQPRDKKGRFKKSATRSSTKSSSNKGKGTRGRKAASGKSSNYSSASRKSRSSNAHSGPIMVHVKGKAFGEFRSLQAAAVAYANHLQSAKPVVVELSGDNRKQHYRLHRIAGKSLFTAKPVKKSK